MEQRTGQAACKQCGQYVYGASLTGETRPCDHCSGKEWECAPDQSCDICGVAFNWLHVPPPESLLLTYSAEIREVSNAEAN